MENVLKMAFWGLILMIQGDQLIFANDCGDYSEQVAVGIPGGALVIGNFRLIVEDKTATILPEVAK